MTLVPSARRYAILALGISAYLSSQLVLAYTFGFVGGFFTPTTLDGEARSSPAVALAVDLALLSGFALQHSVMARRPWKRLVGRLGPGLERPVYVLASSVVLGVLYAGWQPIPTALWELEGSAAGVLLSVVSLGGWFGVLTASLVIGHFHLFGLAQSWAAFHGRDLPPQPLRARALYRHVRHPMYLGTLVAFWCAPTLTWGRVVFAAAMTAYVLMAVRWEERDLLAEYGPAYAAYCQRVPRFLPSLRPVRSVDAPACPKALPRAPDQLEESA